MDAWINKVFGRKKLRVFWGFLKVLGPKSFGVFPSNFVSFETKRNFEFFIKTAGEIPESEIVSSIRFQKQLRLKL